MRTGAIMSFMRDLYRTSFKLSNAIGHSAIIIIIKRYNLSEKSSLPFCYRFIKRKTAIICQC